MTKHYNKLTEKNKRKELRKNSTSSERKLWQYLKNKQIKECKFRRQYSIDNYILDFYCHKAMLAIEIDGDIEYVINQIGDALLKQDI